MAWNYLLSCLCRHYCRLGMVCWISRLECIILSKQNENKFCCIGVTIFKYKILLDKIQANFNAFIWLIRTYLLTSTNDSSRLLFCLGRGKEDFYYIHDAELLLVSQKSRENLFSQRCICFTVLHLKRNSLSGFVKTKNKRLTWMRTGYPLLAQESIWQRRV